MTIEEILAMPEVERKIYYLKKGRKDRATKRSRSLQRLESEQARDSDR